MVSDLPLMAFKFGKERKQVLTPLLILCALSLVAAIFLQWWAVPVAFVLYISLSLIYKQKVNV